MTHRFVKLAASVLLVLLLAACGTSSPSARSVQINGAHGGILYTSGVAHLAYVMDVTTSNNQVTGYGLITDGANDVSLSVSGTTSVGAATLTLRDSVGARINLTVTKNGAIYQGTWNTSFDSSNGTTRFTHESNIDNLALQVEEAASGAGLADLF